MAFTNSVEILAKRRFTFLFVFALVAAAGISFLQASQPVYRYTAQVDLSIAPASAPDTPPQTPLSVFLSGDESARQACARNPQIINMAAAMLKDSQFVSSAFDLREEIEPRQWEQFLSMIRFSAALESASPERVVLTAGGDTQVEAEQLVKAVAAALMQHLRGSARPLSAELSDGLSRASREAETRRQVWEAFSKAAQTEQLIADHKTDLTKLQSIRVTHEQLDRQWHELEQKLVALLKVRHLRRWHADEAVAVGHYQKSLAQTGAARTAASLEKEALAVALEDVTPVITEEKKLADDLRVAEEQLKQLKKEVGLVSNRSAVADKAVTLSAAHAARELAPVGQRYSIPAIALILFSALFASTVITLGRETLASRAPAPPSTDPAQLNFDLIAQIPLALDTSPLDLIEQPGVTEAITSLVHKLPLNEISASGLWLVSARRWEGKTTVAVAIAKQLAEQGKRVLLVDANIHNPSLHHVFDFSNEYGLTTLLERHGEAASLVEQIRTGESKALELEDLIVSTPINNLKVLPGGPPPIDPEYNPLAADLKRVLRQASAHADLVLYDGPALSRRSEVDALASILHPMLIVLAPSESEELDIVSTNYVFNELRHHVLGVIMNRKIPNESALADPQGAATEG